jgi:hypothetical protein
MFCNRSGNCVVHETILDLNASLGLWYLTLKNLYWVTSNKNFGALCTTCNRFTTRIYTSSWEIRVLRYVDYSQRMGYFHPYNPNRSSWSIAVRATMRTAKPRLIGATQTDLGEAARTREDRPRVHPGLPGSVTVPPHLLACWHGERSGRLECRHRVRSGRHECEDAC